MTLRRGGRLLMLAPHPDDETLGCGALLAQAARAGATLMIVALTDGQASHPRSQRWPPKRLGQRRRGELKQALGRLGARRAAVRYMGWRDLRLREDASVLRLRGVVTAFRPDLIITMDRSDHHPDHQTAHDIAEAVRGRVPLWTVALWAKLQARRVPRARGAGHAAKRWATAAYRSQMPGVIADDPSGFTFAPDVLRLLRDSAEELRPVTRRTRPRVTSAR